MSHAPINFELVVGVGIEPTFRVFQTRANPSQLSDLELERAVRLELTNTGSAIRRLSRLATRAIWNSRQDSNLQPRRSKRRALPVEPQEQMFGAPYRI